MLISCSKSARSPWRHSKSCLAKNSAIVKQCREYACRVFQKAPRLDDEDADVRALASQVPLPIWRLKIPTSCSTVAPAFPRLETNCIESLRWIWIDFFMAFVYFCSFYWCILFWPRLDSHHLSRTGIICGLVLVCAEFKLSLERLWHRYTQMMLLAELYCIQWCQKWLIDDILMRLSVVLVWNVFSFMVSEPALKASRISIFLRTIKCGLEETWQKCKWNQEDHWRRNQIKWSENRQAKKSPKQNITERARKRYKHKYGV